MSESINAGTPISLIVVADPPATEPATEVPAKPKKKKK